MKRHDESISDRLRRMAATDELAVGRGRAEQIASRALARVESRPRRRARLVAAIVSGSAFAIVSVTGVGAIADQAVPGDSLYPVDRAYESISRVIGRDVDRTQERIEEAIALVERGDRVAAANHVNTELGERSPVIALPVETVDPNPVVTTVPAPVDEADPSQAAAVAVEAPPATTPETVPAPAESVPTVEDQPDGPAGDPFLLALENALRATQAAAGTDDELIAAEADDAVRSVVKLAAGETEDAPGTSPEVQVAPGAVSVQTTTTTTATTTTVARGNSGSAPGNSTSTTTTTSVPNDPAEEPPGDGETAGDDSSGSQEGSGSAGEPGDAGDESPGPVILPIP